LFGASTTFVQHDSYHLFIFGENIPQMNRLITQYINSLGFIRSQEKGVDDYLQKSVENRTKAFSVFFLAIILILSISIGLEFSLLYGVVSFLCLSVFIIILGIHAIASTRLNQSIGEETFPAEYEEPNVDLSPEIRIENNFEPKIENNFEPKMNILLTPKINIENRFDPKMNFLLDPEINIENRFDPKMNILLDPKVDVAILNQTQNEVNVSVDAEIGNDEEEISPVNEYSDAYYPFHIKNAYRNRNLDFEFLKMNEEEAQEFLKLLSGNQVSFKIEFKITSITRPKDPHYNAIFSIFDILIDGGIQQLSIHKKKAFFDLIDQSFLMSEKNIKRGVLEKSYSTWVNDIKQNRSQSPVDLLDYFRQNIFK